MRVLLVCADWTLLNRSAAGTQSAKHLGALSQSGAKLRCCTDTERPVGAAVTLHARASFCGEEEEEEEAKEEEEEERGRLE